jgi:hypothetical protein
MKKILLYILGALAIMGIAFAIYLWSTNTPRPQGQSGPEAEAMADLMLEAVDKSAWDSTACISWSFPGGHDYVWNKANDQVQVSWGDHRVLLNTSKVDGIAYIKNEEVTDREKHDAIQTAWSYFCNDSWWLNPMVKAKDPGTERSKVTLEDGRTGLMVEYTSGGVTPGDAYVYVLDADGLPTSYLMWVQIIPVGGVEFKMDEWTTLYSGAKLPLSYPGAAFTLKLENVKAGASLADLGQKEDLFEPLNVL